MYNLIVGSLLSGNVPGENPIVLDTKNLKVIAKKETVSNLATAPLVVPQSAEDIANGTIQYTTIVVHNKYLFRLGKLCHFIYKLTPPTSAS